VRGYKISNFCGFSKTNTSLGKCEMPFHYFTSIFWKMSFFCLHMLCYDVIDGQMLFVYNGKWLVQRSCNRLENRENFLYFGDISKEVIFWSSKSIYFDEKSLHLSLFMCFYRLCQLKEWYFSFLKMFLSILSTDRILFFNILSYF
jgi:hypothetical protein